MLFNCLYCENLLNLHSSISRSTSFEHNVHLLLMEVNCTVCGCVCVPVCASVQLNGESKSREWEQSELLSAMYWHACVHT